jgi:serine/threonine protein kinase
MISDDFRLTLINLGHANVLGTVQEKKIGTKGYRAPYITGETDYLIDNADLYALGCTLFTILFQAKPFGIGYGSEEF